jgi:hypothetical protein
LPSFLPAALRFQPAGPARDSKRLAPALAMAVPDVPGRTRAPLPEPVPGRVER